MKNMELLVATDTCSKKKEEYLAKRRDKQVVNPQQKFFRLLIEGLSEQANMSATVISALPVSASTYEQRIFRHETEVVNKACYHYIGFINGRFLRYITLAIGAVKCIKKWYCKNNDENAIVLVDPLVPVLSIPVRKFAQKKGIKVGAIVTDIPSLCSNAKKCNFKTKMLKIYQSISDNDLTKYDFYVPLTESLDEVVNKSGKPHCVIEGFADSKDLELSKFHKNYFMYAGGVHERFGLKALVNGFIKMKNKDKELWIFGDGSYVEDLVAISKVDARVKYKGCVTSQEVVAYEKEAFCLVNPRPTNEEFAKYSFPSKTMEYLLSGTPVISTKLPGIPEEYFKYLFAFDGFDENAIAKKLDEIVEMDSETLFERGKKGHEFVLKEKNNIVMANKLVDFLGVIKDS